MSVATVVPNALLQGRPELPPKAAIRERAAREEPLSTEQQKLMHSHMDLVKAIARQEIRKMPKTASYDDVLGAGMLGLADACLKYDASKCSRFEPYAIVRIRGAIWDSLRAADYLSRSERKRLRKAETEAEQDFGQQSQVNADQVAPVTFIPSEEAAEDNELALQMSRRSPFPDPFNAFVISELRSNMQNMGSKRRTDILRLRYQYDLSFKQISRVFGVSEARAWQLHDEALKMLRAHYASFHPM